VELKERPGIPGPNPSDWGGGAKVREIRSGAQRREKAKKSGGGGIWEAERLAGKMGLKLGHRCIGRGERSQAKIDETPNTTETLCIGSREVSAMKERNWNQRPQISCGGGHGTVHLL